MKPLPNSKKLRFYARMFADGDNGRATQEWRNDEYGLTVIATRESRNEPFQKRLLVDGLDGDFGSVAEANEAISKMTPNAN